MTLMQTRFHFSERAFHARIKTQDKMSTGICTLPGQPSRRSRKGNLFYHIIEHLQKRSGISISKQDL